MVKRLGFGSILTGLLAATLSFAAEIQPADWNQPGKKWSHGPVRCLLTAEEEKQLKGLKTDEDFKRFVKEFWERRDPTPGTPANEYLEFFAKRVDEANKRFIQTTETGAISDRGQVFLLLGMPAKVNTGKNMEWVYENVPHVTPASFKILFHAVEAGNILLLGKKDVEAIFNSNEFLRGLGPKAKEIFAPAPAVAQALPALESAPPPEAAATEESKLLDSLAGSDLLPTAIPLQVRTDVYQATKGDSFAVVTLAVARADAGSPLLGFARFAAESGDVRAVTLAAPDSFLPAETENADPSSSVLLFQGGAGLHPGRYILLAGVRSPETGKAGVVKQSIEIPKYEGGGLALSTVALVRKLEGPLTPPAVTDGKKAPFYLGSFRVVPSLDGVFKQGTDMAWYYQIYNAATDPATGQPNLTIQYDFLLKQKGDYHPVTAPQIEKNRTSQIAAFSFQLIKPTATQKGWVDGDYKLAIKVTDEVAQKSVTQEIPFRVIP
ncbi:MAG TPA: GWxTD domain-containing protein [Candidatus Polarisedimenticolia bacterium]|jgi:GWxTD domain-containing protein|nr:GWxTD domain-containing protein [Candidatus Polarisedimenticolia bacterium]